MSRFSRLSIILSGLSLAAILGLAACERLPLLAPTGTVINLSVTSEVAALNSSVDVIAVLIENGGSSGTGTGTSSSTTAAGTPVQNGTVVSFTTTIGTIEPAEAKTQNGRVNVKLVTSGQSGKATITAYSGGAKSTAQITIGAAAVDHVLTSASPANLSSNGGSSTISARVEDVNGNGLSGVQVQFTTTKGTLASATATTNSDGVATTTLNTTATAVVTATVGAKTSDVTVNVATAGSLTVSMTTPTGGSVVKSANAVFTVDAGSGASAVPLKSIAIDYGDGASAQLGAFTGPRPAVHCYASSGIKDVRVTATDPDGLSVSNATQIAVTSLSGTLASSGTATVGSQLTFTVTIQPSGATPAPQIGSYDWEWNTDEGYTTSSTGPSQTHIYTTPGSKTVKVRVNLGCGASSFTITLPITVS